MNVDYLTLRSYIEVWQWFNIESVALITWEVGDQTHDFRIVNHYSTDPGQHLNGVQRMHVFFLLIWCNPISLKIIVSQFIQSDKNHSISSCFLVINYFSLVLTGRCSCPNRIWRTHRWRRESYYRCVSNR